jgi:flavorubredoxin
MAGSSFLKDGMTNMNNITEISPEVFRISTFFPEFNIQFCQFLVRGDEPLLFHTGMRGLFPLVKEAVARLIEPANLRWIGFSYFEADECGALNEWLAVAPNAKPVCSLVGKMVSVDDFVGNDSAKGMMDGEVLETGSHRFRFLATPHVPHCWEAGFLYEEAGGVLFCSDLFHQNGDVAPLTTSDVVGPARETMIGYQAGPLANYLPYTKNTDGELKRLAALKPKVLATMHGSAFEGDGERAINDYALMRRMLDTES